MSKTIAIEDLPQPPTGVPFRRGETVLTYDQHENNVTLFIRVPQNRNLNDIEGLHSYLFTNKERFIELGIQGFAFPT